MLWCQGAGAPSASDNAQREVLRPPCTLAFGERQPLGSTERGGAMSNASKRQRPADTPKRGEAAWRAAKDAIASRNEQASRLARARRQAADDERAARKRAAELHERAELAKRSF